PVVDARQCDQQERPARSPDDLADDEVVGIPELHQPDDEAGAVHDDEAGQREDDGEGHDGVIRAAGFPAARLLCGGYGDTSGENPGSARTSWRNASPRTSKLG